MRYEWEEQKKPARSGDNVLNGWELYLIVLILCGALTRILPPYLYLPSFIALLIVVQYLWHIGFFKSGYTFSRRDRDVAKKIEASQQRLRRERNSNIEVAGSGQVSGQVTHTGGQFPSMNWVCPSCTNSIRLDQGERYCTECGYKIR